jgi:hypothetical protein
LPNLTGSSMPAGGFLGKDQLSIHGYLEKTSGRLHQAHLCIREHLFQLSRQTGGSGLVVSDNAVLNRHIHIIDASRKKMEANRRES